MTQAHLAIDFSIPAMRTWKNLPEGTLAEVINEKLYLSPSPTPFHARVAHRISTLLRNYIVAHELGEVLPAPVDVILGSGTAVVIPDITFISKDNPLIIDRKGVHGPPDLCLEVLSPGTKNLDLTIKKSLYANAGVKEYWIVDPETKNTLGYLLENGKYGEPLLLNSELYIRVLKKSINF